MTWPNVSAKALPLLVANRRTSKPSTPVPFGLSFNPILSEIPASGELLGWIGARRARVTLWDVPPPAQGSPPSDAAHFDYLQRLAQGAPEGLEITGVLARPPRSPASRRDFDTMAEFLAQDKAVWEPPVRATLSRFRELVPCPSELVDSPFGGGAPEAVHVVALSQAGVNE